MSYGMITGYHSHRHPFLGVDSPADLDVQEALAVDVEEALAGNPPAALSGAESAANVRSALFEGAISGLVVYFVARRTGITETESQKLAWVLGGISAGVALLTGVLAGALDSSAKTA